jgi:hypothetical protein
MSDSWRDLYKGHIERHRFQILDGRVTLRNAAPIREGNYGDVYTGSLKSLEAGSQPEEVAVKTIRGRSIEDAHIRVRHVCADEADLNWRSEILQRAAHLVQARQRPHPTATWDHLRASRDVVNNIALDVERKR